MDKLIESINHALDMSRNRLQWYSVTRDSNHLVESKGWNEIANYNIDRLIFKYKSESVSC